MAIRSKKYTGSIPRGEKWGAVDDFMIGKNEWEVFIDTSATSIWVDVKVVCIGRAAKKANYWFKWNGERMSECTDANAMRDYRPDLYARVMAVLNERHGGLRESAKIITPLTEKGYKAIGEISAHGVMWDVYLKDVSDESGWKNYAIEARTKIMKTNKIYIGWNGERFAINTSLATLKSMHELHGKFMEGFID
jgi:hypothetical protein